MCNIQTIPLINYYVTWLATEIWLKLNNFVDFNSTLIIIYLQFLISEVIN